MNSFGFLGATVFDYYLNPRSDLRISLDTVLSRVLPTMKQEIRASAPHSPSHLSTYLKERPRNNETANARSC